MDVLKKFNNDQLESACSIMETYMVNFIKKLDNQGIDTSDLRQGLNEAHSIVEGLEYDEL